MSASGTPSTSAGARILRGCGVLLVCGLWMGVTLTTEADGSGVRPGDSVSAAPTVVRLAPEDPARALPRLTAQAALLTGPAGKKLYATLQEAQAWLAASPPAVDAEEDAQALAAASPVTDVNSVPKTADAATQSLALAASLGRASLSAEPELARRMLTAASSIDAQARAALTAAKKTISADAGLSPALVSALSAANIKDPLLGLDAALKPALAGAMCTGDAAVTVTQDPEASAAPSALPTETDGATTTAGPIASSATGTSAETDDAPQGIQATPGFPSWPVEDAALSNDRTDAFHEASATAGRLSYAASVVSARAGTADAATRAARLSSLTLSMQAAQPAGCAPVVTTTAGPWDAFTGTHATAGLKAGQAELSAQLLQAASGVTGEARLRLLGLWNQLRG